MSDQPNNQEEKEVDLVPVFTWIGNGFKNLFKAIGDVFKGIGNFLVLTLLFMKKHLVLLAVLFLIGAGLGYYLDLQNKKSFNAILRVQPNFNSAAQLISNINLYQSLIEQEDFASLANKLEINEEQAQTLGSFEIEASYTDNELLAEYDALARKSDTMALMNFTFEGFKAAKRDIDYEFYKVIIAGTDREVVNKVSEPAVTVQDNSGIKALRQSAKENNAFDLKVLEYQLQETDSLIASYQKAIAGNSTSGASSGTNLYLGDQKPSDALKDLFGQKSTLLYKISEAREDKYKFAKTVNVLSQYVTKGSVEKKHYKIKLAFIFLGCGMLLALIPLLWSYLNRLESQRK